MFEDRADAGRRLATRLEAYRAERPIVLGLPRGGVVVANEIARALGAPLDVLVTRKVGAPGRPEFGIGAVVDGEHPEAIVDDRAVRTIGVSAAYLEAEIARQLAEVRRRNTLLRGGRPRLDLRDRTVIVVDDGIATGGTVRAALQSVRRAHPRRVVLAVPVAPPGAISALRTEADAVVCLETPRHFHAVGQFYRDFRQTTDDEVIDLLARTADDPPRRLAANDGSPCTTDAVRHASP
jgi:putative phosphoribosyl transferase